jgi:hypothetical protein
MKSKEMLQAWRDGEQNDALANVVGAPVVNEALLREVNGGTSSGYVCTVSGECNGSGRSCWRWPWENAENMEP